MKKTAIFLIIIYVLFIASCTGARDTPDDSAEATTVPPTIAQIGVIPPRTQQPTTEEQTSGSTEQTSMAAPGQTEPVPTTGKINSITTNAAPPTPVTETPRYSYNFLTAEQKSVYKSIKEAIFSLTTSVNVGAATERDIIVARYAVYLDYPEYFWFPNTISYSVISNNTTVSFKYEYNITQINSMIERINISLTKIMNGVKSDMSAYEKQLYIHDYIAKNCKYDKDVKNTADVFGALVNRNANCEGYSKAYKIVLKEAGIDSILITGEAAGEGHMWNAVLISGNWYNTDLTWNSEEDFVVHKYFNMTAKMIEETHEIDPDLTKASNNVILNNKFNIGLPSMTAQTYNFFVRNGTMIESEEQLEEIIISAFNNTQMRENKEFEFCFSQNSGTIFNNEHVNIIFEAIQKYNINKPPPQIIPHDPIIYYKENSRYFRIAIE